MWTLLTFFLVFLFGEWKCLHYTIVPWKYTICWWVYRGSQLWVFPESQRRVSDWPLEHCRNCYHYSILRGWLTTLCIVRWTLAFGDPAQSAMYGLNHRLPPDKFISWGFLGSIFGGCILSTVPSSLSLLPACHEVNGLWGTFLSLWCLLHHGWEATDHGLWTKFLKLSSLMLFDLS